jgi:hypothetical protein
MLASYWMSSSEVSKCVVHGIAVSYEEQTGQYNNQAREQQQSVFMAGTVTCDFAVPVITAAHGYILPIHTMNKA